MPETAATVPIRREIQVRDLGTMAYGQALRIQQQAHEARKQVQGPDMLFLVEHLPVITTGRSAKQEHVLLDQVQLQQAGVELFDTGRGGDVTFHGPGQLVAYPIVDLHPDRCDVRRYVRDLEEVMIRVIADYGLRGERVAGLNGTWVQNRKIGAVGVRISRWVTMHGIALNVSTDLAYFDMIIPCGISDRAVTTLEKELGRKIDLAEVKNRFCTHFAEVFNASLLD